jgi:hypothetical protein
MKTIYKILLFTIIMQTSAFSQFEVLSIIKPTTSVEPCDGKINLEFVESELPYYMTVTNTTTGDFEEHYVTTTILTVSGQCPGNITIYAVNNCHIHKCIHKNNNGELIGWKAN